jgi:hypothetical protein
VGRSDSQQFSLTVSSGDGKAEQSYAKGEAGTREAAALGYLQGVRSTVSTGEITNTENRRAAHKDVSANRHIKRGCGMDPVFQLRSIARLDSFNHPVHALDLRWRIGSGLSKPMLLMPSLSFSGSAGSGCSLSYRGSAWVQSCSPALG